MELSGYDQGLLAGLHPIWALLPEAEAQAAIRELQGELAPGHPLHGQDVLLLARRVNNDDYLGYHPGLLTPWFSVRLTWLYARHGIPETPPWPGTQFYETLEDFIASAKTAGS